MADAERVIVKFLSPKFGTDWHDTEPQVDPGADTNLKEMQDQNASESREHLASLFRTCLSSNNITVLSGLGTSLCVTDFLDQRLAPTMSDLWSACLEDRTQEQQDSLFSKVHFDPRVSGENIEYLLSQCQIAATFLGDQEVQDFLGRAETIIADKCRFVTPESFLDVHETFLRKLARRPIRLGRLKVFTTNYDTCFEEASQRSGFACQDGFAPTSPSYFDPAYFSYDIVRRRSGETADEYIPNLFYLYKMHGSVNWTQDGEEIRKQVEPTNPLLIYPRDSKYESSYRRPFVEIMAEFHSSIRENDSTLVVVGFGFNDSHIAEPIMSAMRSNIGINIIVVAPGLESAENIHVSRLRKMAEDGDARVNLVSGTFEEFSQAIPDLVAPSEVELHEARMRSLSS